MLASMPTSPNSLIIRARRLPVVSLSKRLINVVLPAPRKPVITVAEIGCARDMDNPEPALLHEPYSRAILVMK